LPVDLRVGALALVVVCVLFVALSAVGGYLLQARAQGGLLVGVEDREHPLFCAGERMFGLRDSAGSGC
jgi:hypothetical protein